jgi:hypothetical protein
VDLAPLLNAHAFLRVERPPTLWEAEVDDVRLVRLLGEMIAAALVRGTALDDIVLRASNVTVEWSSAQSVPAAGDYVALTVLGVAGEWGPEVTWRPGLAGGAVLMNAELEAAVMTAGVPFAYSRSSGVGGSVTVFLRRCEA